jgi:hypothetical protein
MICLLSGHRIERRTNPQFPDRYATLCITCGKVFETNDPAYASRSERTETSGYRDYETQRG